MRNIFIFLFILLLSSCSILGTSTLYETKRPINISNIGFINLCNDRELNRYYYNTSKIYDSTIIEFSKKYGFKNIKRIDIPCKVVDSIFINKVCKEYHVDGVLIGTLEFISTSSSDTEVRMTLVDKDGYILIVAGHNTFWGNSYFLSISEEITIRDGTKGALKRVLRELRKLNVDEYQQSDNL